MCQPGSVISYFEVNLQSILFEIVSDPLFLKPIIWSFKPWTTYSIFKKELQSNAFDSVGGSIVQRRWLCPLVYGSSGSSFLETGPFGLYICASLIPVYFSL